VDVTYIEMGKQTKGEIFMNAVKFILKIPVKILLTIIYPILRLTVLNAMDQLSGQTTGFLQGLKSLWKW
jgi:hypothetical protein